MVMILDAVASGAPSHEYDLIGRPRAPGVTYITRPFWGTRRITTRSLQFNATVLSVATSLFFVNCYFPTSINLARVVVNACCVCRLTLYYGTKANSSPGSSKSRRQNSQQRGVGQKSLPLAGVAYITRDTELNERLAGN